MNESLYRYKGCGLDHVYLVNGYEIKKNAKGEDVVRVEDIDGLHSAIAMHIVESSAPLDGKTFRFLRKERDMSQRQVAMILGCEEQTVSNWERGQVQLPQSADLFLRALTKESLSGRPELQKLIELFNKLDRDLRANEREMSFSRAANDGWELQRAA